MPEPAPSSTKTPPSRGSTLLGCLVLVVAAVVVLVLIGFVTQLFTGGDEDGAKSSAEASASPSPSVSASPTTSVVPVLKDYTGRSYKEVHNEITEAGGSVTALNAEDSLSNVSAYDPDWKVCDQSIAAGGPIRGEITVVAAKEGVPCLTIAEKEAFLAEKERVAAEEQAARAAERAAREAEAAAPVVLTEGDISACAALAGGIDDVVTDQDRSDLARAVRYFSDDSTDPRFVKTGESLTKDADSFTGIFWLASTATFTDLCIRGGYNDLPNVN